MHTKKIVALSIFLLVSAFFAALPAPKVSAEVSINALSKSEGFVGDLVGLTGQINTVNGSYEILFDGTLVKSGNATFTAVMDTFVVPNSTSGDHTVRLRDVLNATESRALNFTVKTKYFIKAITPQAPKQLQEGANVTLLAGVTGGEANKTLRVNMTVQDPLNVTYSSNEFLILINQTGYGSAIKLYPTDFNGNPHTFFVGLYNLSLIDLSNETLATGNFTVGLTDATEYHRFQTVFIQAANYTSTEWLMIKITSPNETIELPPSNASGPLGIITANWTIPANASLGLYTVEVVYTKPLGPEKPVSDIQNFTIVSKYFTCEVRVFNLDNEPVRGVLVEAWNLTSPPIASDGTTNEAGVASFSLEATDYTFKAFWNVSIGPKSPVGESEVIHLDRDFTGALAVNITASLAHIKVAVKDVNEAALPLVNVRLTFVYRSRLGVPITPSPLSSETNVTGATIFKNMFVNVNYTITVSRYDYTFDSVTVNLTSTRWVNITCPTYELIINVYDRDGSALQNAEVKIYEWSIGLSGLAGTGDTDVNGEVTFNSTFGKYRVDVYKDGVFLNETTVLLVSQPTTFAVYCKLCNLTLDVNVLDYFGQGIPNANVTIEREGTVLSSLNTGADGIARFTGIIGGHYRILIYIGGKPYRIASLYLQDPETVTLKIGGLVLIGSFIAETSYFVTAVFILLVIAVLLFTFLYRRFRSSEKKE